jgi:hypothetical protein
MEGNTLYRQSRRAIRHGLGDLALAKPLAYPLQTATAGPRRRSRRSRSRRFRSRSRSRSPSVPRSPVAPAFLASQPREFLHNVHGLKDFRQELMDVGNRQSMAQASNINAYLDELKAHRRQVKARRNRSRSAERRSRSRGRRRASRSRSKSKSKSRSMTRRSRRTLPRLTSRSPSPFAMKPATFVYNPPSYVPRG